MSNFLYLVKLVFLAMIALTFSAVPVWADDEEDEDGGAKLDLSNVFDFKMLSGMNARLSPHGNGLMGDMIDKNTGGISFQHTDIFYSWKLGP